MQVKFEQIGFLGGILAKVKFSAADVNLPL
jgi:hypothetical protein